MENTVNYTANEIGFFENPLLLIFCAIFVSIIVLLVGSFIKEAQKKKKSIKQESLNQKIQSVNNESIKPIENIETRNSSGDKDYIKNLLLEYGKLQNSNQQTINYKIPGKFLKGKNNNFFPSVSDTINKRKVTPISLAHESIKKGVTEIEFCKLLQKTFGKSLKESATFEIPGTTIGRAYTPDAVIEIGDISIIIEVDEPYVGSTREPIHYINSTDVDRDVFFAENGWITIRFAEEQVFKQSNHCVFFIADLISSLNPSFKFNCIVNTWPYDVKRWTILEAIEMAKENYREKYLKIDFVPEEIEPTKTIEFSPNSSRTEKPHLIGAQKPKFITRNIEPTNDNIKIESTNTRSLNYSLPEAIHSLISNNYSLYIIYSKFGFFDVEGGGSRGEGYLVKPLSYNNEENVLIAKNLISLKEEKFSIERIHNDETKIIEIAEIKWITGQSNPTKTYCMECAIQNKFIARIKYSKESLSEKTYYLSNIVHDEKYPNCINSNVTTNDFNKLTFSLKKITSIEVFFLKSWDELAHWELTTRTTKSSSSYNSSSKNIKISDTKQNSGCLLFLLFGVGILSTFSIIIFYLSSVF